jgi:putative hemolysin
MFRKALVPLFLLMGWLFLASCGAKQASPAPQAGMANPASVYCEKNGGKLELRQDAAGAVAGICIFPDGSECDEWAYFRGECKPGETATTPEPVAALAAGLHITYFNGGKVMSWTTDSRARELVQGNTESLRISDDGQMVAYLGADSAGTYGLYTVNTDGTNPRFLVQNTQMTGQIVAFDFAPASHMLYFVTDQYDLQRVGAESGSPALVFGAGLGGFFSFSPNGQWMVLYHPNELVLTHPDGSAARPAFQYPDDFRFTMMGPEIAWKSDSSGFSMVSASGAQGEAGSMTIWFVPVVGETVRQMSYAGPYGANLAPDGHSVVYLNFQHDPVDVHMVAEDGKDTTCGSYPSNEYPAINFMGWAPDSKSFLLNLSNDGRLMDPYLCKAGKPPVKLTDTRQAYPVVWVDADRFLFISAGQLRLQRRGGPSVGLDSVSSSNFDFTVVNP